MKKYFPFVLLLLIASCSRDMGHKVMGDNLTVYFVNEKDESFATDVAKYFKKENLLTGQAQDLQIVRNEEGFILKMIVSDPTGEKNMSFDERKLLLDLQEELRDSVFGDKYMELVISNNEFETIYKLN